MFKLRYCITFVIVLLNFMAFSRSEAVGNTEPGYKEGDIKPFSCLMKKIRRERSEGIESQVSSQTYTILKEHSPKKNSSQLVSYDKMCELRMSVESEIANLTALKTQHEEAIEADGQKKRRFNCCDFFTFGIWGIANGEGDFDPDDEFDNDSISPEDYEYACSRLPILEKVKIDILEGFKKMDIQIDGKMNVEFLLQRFKNHPNAKFNTSQPEGEARVRGLLRDIYCIE